MRCCFIVLISLILFASQSHAKVIEYQLNISEKKVNISGKEAVALVVNNSMPGPTLRAVVGDTMRVEVKNNLDVDSSIHWHGVLVPNNMDGVPYVNGPPIKPGETFIYDFPIKHSGTYWYHAHSALQEQQGVYGSLVFYPQDEIKDYDEEHVLVLSDWTDENPDHVLANLKKDPDYYALKKDSVQSWLKVIENGFDAIKIRINNAWTRMGPMDMSDIGYDAFLINGKKSSILSHAKPGTRVKFRIINAAASSYFIFEYSGGPMKVIESDGVKVDTFTAQKIRIAMAETYDVIITIPEDKTYEFKASAEDGTGYAVAHIGDGDLVPAPIYPKPNLALMDMMEGMDHSGMGSMNMSGDSEDVKIVANMQDHSMHHGMKMETPSLGVTDQNNMANPSKRTMNDMRGMDHAGIENMGNHSNEPASINDTNPKQQEMQLPHVEYLNNYKPIKSAHITTLPKHQASRVITLKLTGSMERYVWSINDTPMYAADEILIKRGENIKFILVNETMMNHPIHLHGHFFRVLNGQGDYSPLKHTVNVSPFETIEIEFDANAEKDWIFHCHNLYHMKLGMGGVIHYEGTKHDPALMHHAGDHSSDHGNIWFNATKVEGYSNFSNITTKLMRNNDYFIADFRHNYKKDYEGEVTYQRYVSQFLGFYIGGKFEKDKNERINRGIIGIEYTLPLLIKTDLRINSNGRVRFGVSNEHQLTDRMSFDWKWNTDKEYTLGISYAMTKQLYILGNYDSRERWGIGLNLKF